MHFPSMQMFPKKLKTTASPHPGSLPWFFPNGGSLLRGCATHFTSPPACFTIACVGILLPSRACRQARAVLCLHGHPMSGTPGSSYPERSFSITIFCSPAEMLLLPEPGVEARSLVPGSCPLPGALSAVWTSLRIRGKGPNLDMILC